MPRQTIDLPLEVEHLSILDENGEYDEELEPEISDDELLQMHRTMLLSRRFDEKLLTWQRQGRIGTFAPVKGQEASQIGAVAALAEKDWLVPSFREAAASLWRGTPLTSLILYDAGFKEGGHLPEKSRDLPIAIPVASQIPHAVGLAYGTKYRETDEVVLTFFGDGATSEGDFHEALNFAGVLRAPVVFVCQNNQWAISVPREKQSASQTLAQKSVAYGLRGIQVDGNDLLGVYSAATEAVEHARSGDGPTLIECVTYRMSVHTTADDPSKYREEEEVKKWEKRDPIARIQKYLTDKDLLSEEDIESLEEEIGEEIEGAWKDAEKRMEELGSPYDMFEHVYAESPPYLDTQRDDFKSFMDSEKGKDNG
jgi:pyruvate dehydrogenase E1 component alpha subunit